MDLDLLGKMKKMPGGLVIIPLVLAVLIATFSRRHIRSAVM